MVESDASGPSNVNFGMFKKYRKSRRLEACLQGRTRRVSGPIKSAHSCLISMLAPFG